MLDKIVVALERLGRKYEALKDRYMESKGYIPEEQVITTFGGIPDLRKCGFTFEKYPMGSPPTISIGENPKYIWLGPYFKPFKMIQEAAQKGDLEVVFTAGDFGPPVEKYSINGRHYKLLPCESAREWTSRDYYYQELLYLSCNVTDGRPDREQKEQPITLIDCLVKNINLQFDHSTLGF